MPIANITHSACKFPSDWRIWNINLLGFFCRLKINTTLQYYCFNCHFWPHHIRWSKNTVEMGVSARDHTSQQSYNLYVCLHGVKHYPPEMMQPSSSMRVTIVSAENQNNATMVTDKFFFCYYYIVWESNNTGDARGQSWNESLKSRWIPGGLCGYTSGTKRKHFAALSSSRPWWRWLQLQPSCGSPQWWQKFNCWDLVHLMLEVWCFNGKAAITRQTSGIKSRVINHINSLRPSDVYMCRWQNHHWFR